MAVLGKRKAPEPTRPEVVDAQEAFRRHFEARFNPLPREVPREEAEPTQADGVGYDEDDDNSDGSEWGGLSDDQISDIDEDEVPVVEVIDHSVCQAPAPAAMNKRELKAFMSSRPPDQLAASRPTITPTLSSSASSSTLPEDAPSLLAQDLELRRLLAESHLLAPSAALASSFSSAATEPKTFASGRIRQKAIDLRIQALGSKSSILKQDKMPMHMRKGINAAATARETRRRREAKENGIILERETRTKKKRDRRPGFDLGRAAVGRMKGAELRINDRDVKRIEGSRDTFGRKSKR